MFDSGFENKNLTDYRIITKIVFNKKKKKKRFSNRK